MMRNMRREKRSRGKNRDIGKGGDKRREEGEKELKGEYGEKVVRKGKIRGKRKER